ncbi:MAG: restriction endonuclease [Ruminococcus sp.]|nr:restriction endonuclease [Ruminococcus sp.]
MWVFIILSVVFLIIIVVAGINHNREKTELQNKLSDCNNKLNDYSKAITNLDKENHAYKELLNLSDLCTIRKIEKPQLLSQLIDILDSSQIEKTKEIILLKNRIDFLESSRSNLAAIPYMAQIMSDYRTYGLESIAKELDWGYDSRRLAKVANIRTIRKEAKAELEKSYIDRYKLAYVIELFPALQDIIDTEFEQLPLMSFTELSEYDHVKDYISKEEYKKLSNTERNQLALDRYKTRTKTKWQIGRDYELYIGYVLEKEGYIVDYFGSYMNLEDLGRDLIAKKSNHILIVQCKYWSAKKQIHEKHITQLYGTMISYCFENNIDTQKVSGLLVTNIFLSEKAKEIAKHLGIQYRENIPIDDYPCIKCNIGHDDFGTTHIYHLPFDQQYDTTKIDKKGEFMAMTVKEAEKAGFRRAYRWFGND